MVPFVTIYYTLFLGRKKVWQATAGSTCLM